MAENNYETQLRLEALEKALRMSYTGTTTKDVLKRAEEFYKFITKDGVQSGRESA
jgi:hypothetical protein